MGFSGFDPDKVTSLGSDLKKAGDGAAALHRSIGAILADAQGALDPGVKATTNPQLENVLRTSAGNGVLKPNAPVPAGAGLPGSLGPELDGVAREITRRLALFDKARQPHAFGDGLSPVDAFNGITTRAKPQPKPKKRPWWKKWVLDPLEDAAYDVANVMHVVCSLESLKAIGETALGIGLLFLGAAGEIGGGALDITVVGAGVGLTLNVGGVVAITGGGALAAKGLGDFMNAMANGDYNAWSRDRRKGPQPKQPREADPLKDEGYGGHGVTKHVGRSDQQLGDRLAQEPGVQEASTFEKTGDAQRFSQQAIDANKQQVSNWLTGAKEGSTKEFTLKDTGEVTGRALSRTDWRDGTGSRPVNGVQVVLRADPDAPGGYYILTTYPVG
ncbi:RNase A-like domain-containing protein [Actinacidiphila guanduensis]|uniref:Bacterial CdiA-CT RNAse A domain-containing protein n=1 Tax=Actinacidiphila guanduensis TaxID=310781 RepID=A0A1H0C6T6_9ACTN|nr:RNase A-like domain-containing protein [Actinacidiphila guanduensis]SDN53568.1 hypothetical protein SAMN05216259_104442 [Actinacidiphila guanduensis]